MSLEPDFINFFEWDEWNENTLIRPAEDVANEVAVNGALVYSKGGDFNDFRTTSDYDVFSVTVFAKRYTDFKRFAKARPKLTVEGVSKTCGSIICEHDGESFDQRVLIWNSTL